MISKYLFNSRVSVSRPRVEVSDGILTTSWFDVDGMEEVPCRLEVGFFRPGKDFPLPAQAGRSPDRVAVYWVAAGTDFRPGDYIRCVSGPITGSTWQIRTVPDAASGMRYLHHLEGQAVEVPGSVVAGSRVG